MSEKKIEFNETDLKEFLRGIFRNDTTKLEHHQPNRFGEMPPVVDGRQTDRWFEPKEIALQIARWKLGDTKFLWE